MILYLYTNSHYITLVFLFMIFIFKILHYLLSIKRGAVERSILKSIYLLSSTLMFLFFLVFNLSASDQHESSAFFATSSSAFSATSSSALSSEASTSSVSSSIDIESKGSQSQGVDLCKGNRPSIKNDDSSKEFALLTNSARRILTVPSIDFAVPWDFTEMLPGENDYPKLKDISDINSGKLLPKEVVGKLLKSRYGLISAGLNTANGETTETVDVKTRHHQLLKDLKAEQFTKEGRKQFDFIQEVEGRYGGPPELSLFIHFTSAKTVKDIENDINLLKKLGRKFGQDSVIYSIHGRQFMIYTTDITHGTPVVRSGKMYTGVGLTVFENEPGDFYTKFYTSQGSYFFTLNFDFNQLQESWEAWKGHFFKETESKFTNFTFYKNVDQQLALLSSSSSGETSSNTTNTTTSQPILTILRGLENYREWAIDAMKSSSPESPVFAINKDALIYEMEQEMYEGKDTKHALSSFEINYTRDGANNRMEVIARKIMSNKIRPNIVVGAVHINASTLVPWVLLALEYGYKVVAVNTGELINRHHYLTFLDFKVNEFKDWKKDQLLVALPSKSSSSSKIVKVPQVHEVEFKNFSEFLNWAQLQKM